MLSLIGQNMSRKIGSWNWQFSVHDDIFNLLASRRGGGREMRLLGLWKVSSSYIYSIIISSLTLGKVVEAGITSVWLK